MSLFAVISELYKCGVLVGLQTNKDESIAMTIWIGTDMHDKFIDIRREDMHRAGELLKRFWKEQG